LTDYKCIQITGEEGTEVNVSPCHPIALRPDTNYMVSGSARIGADADLSLEINNTKTKIIHDKNKEWTDFKYEFVTSPNEWWLDNMRFVLNKKGIAWIEDLSIKEASGEAELLWEADVNRPAMGYYNQLDCFMLDKILESAEENSIYLQLCLLTRDLYMDLLKDDNSPEYQKAINYAKKLLR
jgi:hypothetical protein